jgi:hypothetical protein
MTYQIVNHFQIERRSKDKADPRHIFYQALLNSQSYEQYKSRLKGKPDPVYPDSYQGGKVGISADMEFRYVRDSRKWIVESPHQSNTTRAGSGAFTDWTLEEVKFAVDAYFEMLRKQSAGTSFSKKESNNKLREKLNGRSPGSVEQKHMNISAVLQSHDLPWIKGYAPKGNVQHLLKSVVLEYVAAHPNVIDTTLELPALPKSLNPFVDPPDPRSRKEANGIQAPRKVDFAAVDAGNRKLGRAGEEWVKNLLIARLKAAGKTKLAADVVWTSDEKGDGLGYDIEAFDDNGDRLFIEVKTTSQGIDAAFHISANEALTSKKLGQRFAIYRVFDFWRTPKVYILYGDVEKTCDLRPTSWVATVKKN